MLKKYLRKKKGSVGSTTAYKILGISAFVITIGGMIFYIVTTSPTGHFPRIDRTKPTPTKPVEPQLTLALTPKTISAQPNEVVTVSLTATADRPVLAVDLYLQYDPKILLYKSSTPGSYYTNPMIFARKTDAAKGIVFSAIGALQQEKITGVLMTYTFTAKQKGTVTLALSPQTIASMKGALKADIHTSSKTIVTIQ